MIHKIDVKPDTQASKILFFNSIDLSTLPNMKIVPLFGANGSGKTTLLKAIETWYNREGRIRTLLKKREEDDTKINNSNERKKRDISVDSLNDVLMNVRAESLNKEEKRNFWDEQIEHEESKKQISLIRDERNGELLYTYRNSDDNFRVKQARTVGQSFDPCFIQSRFDALSLSEGQSIVYSAFDLLNGLLPGRNDFIEGDTGAVVLLDEIDSGLSLDNLDAALKKIRRIIKGRENVQIFFSFNTSYVLKYFPWVISMYDGQAHELSGESEMLQEMKNNKKMLDKARKRSGRYKIF